MKIYIIPYPTNFNPLYFCPRGTHITRSGLLENGVEFVTSYDEADFALLDYVPHDGEKKWEYDYIKPYESKLVCIDWVDEPGNYIYYPSKTLAYFKRSYCLPNTDPNSQELCTSRKEINHPNVQPFAYCALPEFSIDENLEHSARPIQLGSYLRYSCLNRGWVLSVMQQICKEATFSYHIGEVNQASRSVGTKCYYDNEYLQYLANTRIIITCQPKGHEGDSRLWESLMSGALVITDKIFTPYENKPEHGKHLVEFDIGDPISLYNQIEYYLNHPDEAQQIANTGREYVIKNHMPKSRMKIVVDYLKNLM